MNALYGGREENLAHAERALGVKLVTRDDWVKIDGPADAVARAESLFDFLDKASTQALAKQVIRMLRPGGAVMALFCTAAKPDHVPFTKYEIVDDANFRHRAHPGVGGVKKALQNRDIIRMFEGLVVADSFLLKSNIREMLLRGRSPSS